MEAGIQVFNTSNTLQVDSTFYNLCLKYKGTVVTGSDNQPFASEFTLACKDPVLAFRCTTDFVYVIDQIDNSNGTWTFKIGSVGRGTTVNYYIYDVPSLGPSNMGMQVFNSGGALVFDTLWPYMLPYTLYQDLNGAAITNDVPINGEPGRVYAMVQNYMGSIHFVGWEDGGGGTSMLYNVSISASVCKFNSNSVAVIGYREVYYKVTGTVSNYGGGGNACYLLVDVTDV